jgi:hypothetical protein
VLEAETSSEIVAGEVVLVAYERNAYRGIREKAVEPRELDPQQFTSRRGMKWKTDHR